MTREDPFGRALDRLADLKALRVDVELYRNQLSVFADQALAEIKILQARIDDAILSGAEQIALQALRARPALTLLTRIERREITPAKALFDALYLSTRRGQRLRHFPELSWPTNFSRRELREWIAKIDDSKLRVAVTERWDVLRRKSQP
jgi:hypothetical protein